SPCDLLTLTPWTLSYADDITITSESKADLEHQAQAWSDHLEMFALCLNVRKMEYLTIVPNECGIDLLRTEDFSVP
ncbi:hypothetical protein JRQ81_000943, partial [Phrynocephalus forsythii]